MKNNLIIIGFLITAILLCTLTLIGIDSLADGLGRKSVPLPVPYRIAPHRADLTQSRSNLVVDVTGSTVIFTNWVAYRTNGFFVMEPFGHPELAELYRLPPVSVETNEWGYVIGGTYSDGTRFVTNAPAPTEQQLLRRSIDRLGEAVRELAQRQEQKPYQWQGMPYIALTNQAIPWHLGPAVTNLPFIGW